MNKTILITGATDGIGFETAKRLAGEGHTIVLHGRSEQKLATTAASLQAIDGVGTVESCRADLSNLAEVQALADAVKKKHATLDVLINNAGVFTTPAPITADGFDVRFVVNTFAPYLLTHRLLPRMTSTSRVINLSSAAQSPVSRDALAGMRTLGDNQAYAQSKLAITMWSAHLARTLGKEGPMIVAVNPASLLASKMVKDAYGVAGKDLSIGADILVRAALSPKFDDASGRYFDNDRGAFSDPHPDALDHTKNAQLAADVEHAIAQLGFQIA